MAEEEIQPRDAKLVKSILQSMGVEHYEPRVVNQFLDFSYRYVVDVLEDSQVYSEHAGKSAIDTDDVKLAIQGRMSQSFSQPPPRETLMELAKLRNRYPLPRIIGGPGLALPPEQDCLIGPNYQLAVPKRSFAEGMSLEQQDGKDALEDREGHSTQQPTHLQRSDLDRKVSFAISTKKLKP